jgi:PKD repeat protein
VTGNAIVCINNIGSYSVPNDPGSTYCWNVPGGTILSNTNNAITVEWTTSGPNILTVRELTKDQVNGNLDSFMVNVINYPVAAFGDSVFHTEAFFTDSSIDAVSWSYSFGDNTVAQTPDPTHSYSSQDTFTVRLIVSNGYCADTAYRTLITDTCPSAETISYTVTGDTVSFTSSPPGVGYSWRFGDGDTANAAAPSHVYTQSQNYLVSLWATTSNDCNVYGSVILPFTEVSTGISTVSGESVNIYPNPTDGILHISALYKAADVTLYDLTGNKVIEQGVNAGADISLNLNSLSFGIYILNITGENISLNRKVIKQ